jgi:cell division septation protein DedD
VGEVTATAPPTPTPSPSREQAASGSGEAGEEELWAIQVASFRTLDRARTLAMQLREDTGEPVLVSPLRGESGIWYRVLVGEYDSLDRVARRMEDLQDRYDFGFLRRVRVPSGWEAE